MQTLNLTTPQLHPGDIVLEHGMRVLLDRPARVYHPDGQGCYWPDGTITDHEYCLLGYSWLGTVLNVDEVRAARVVPMSFLAYNVWNVQGNELAHWIVEREDTPS